MTRAALITLHGMGETARDYADSMLDKVDNGLSEGERSELSIGVVYYQDLLQDNQRRVWDACSSAQHLSFADLRKFLLFGFGDAAGLETNKDDPGSTYEDAQLEIVRQLLMVRGATSSNPPLVVIAQSLGGQVFSDFIWDAQRARAAADDPAVPPPRAGIWQPGTLAARLGRMPSAQELSFLQGDTLSCIVTTGCNIPIFVAAHRAMNIKAIARPNDGFEWHNFFDPQDVLGWPLQPLGGGYETLVRDHSINAGGILRSWNPLSHTAYWTDADVVRPLLQQLHRALAGPVRSDL